MIHVSHIYKSYAGQCVLADINMNVRTGETVCLLGPSGCGKTTLLRLIAGFEKADRGDISCKAGDIGYLFQDRDLLPWRSVFRNVALGMEFQKRTDKEIREVVSDYLEQLDLTDAAKKRPYQISGGMKRRVALAQILVTNPAILFLDEPLTGLDVNGRKLVSGVIKRYIDAHKAASVIVTHSIEEALFLADRVLIFSQRPAHIMQDISLDHFNRDGLFDKILAAFTAANPQGDCCVRTAS